MTELQINLENLVTTLDSQAEHQHQISVIIPANHVQIKISEIIRAHPDQIVGTVVQTNGLQTEMTVDQTAKLHPVTTSIAAIQDPQKKLLQIHANTEIHHRTEMTVDPTVDQIIAPTVAPITALIVKNH